MYRRKTIARGSELATRFRSDESGDDAKAPSSTHAPPKFQVARTFQTDSNRGIPMLKVTSTAIARLSKQLAEYPDDIAARVVRREGRMKLRPDTALPGDETFVHNGRTVLLLDRKLAKRLARKTLDVHQTENGPRLRFSRAT